MITYFCKENDEKVYGGANHNDKRYEEKCNAWDGLKIEADLGGNTNILMFDGTNVVFDTEKIAKNELKAQIQQLKQQRDESLNSNTVTINGHDFNARPKDLSNIELGIEKGDTLWPDVNDFMVDVTVSDLTTLLNTGISQGEAIWDNYKQAVKDIQAV